MKLHMLVRSCVIVCAALAANQVLAQNAAVTVSVDAGANRHAISPFVYGVALATPAQLSDLNAPLNRYGGNNASRYNWQQNADNRANDWFYESVPETSATAGERGDTFIANAHGAGAEPMVTIPMLDWVAKLGANRAKLSSYSVAKYGAQTGTDSQWFADAGNGVSSSTGQPITGNNPADANVAAGTAFQQPWVNHLIAQWGTAANGGLKYYILDNEHSIWHSTHRDVHPTGATMDEIRQKMIDYGLMVRTADAGAQIVGPEEWGWSGYLYSGYDQQYGAAHNWSSFPDRAAHGNADYMPWLLGQLKAYEQQSGKRVLDVFSLHYYPQNGEFSDDTSSAMQSMRNKTTRSLWDRNYTDPSWIASKVYLIPHMKDWLAASYPGLKTAITEYNWGAEGHINGATTQADIYGIFGREGLDMAARWTTPANTTPTYKAMKMYRNYDGQKSGFGDMSVSATAPNPDNLSAFAAQRTSDGALTVMVVGKIAGSTPVTLNLANFQGAGTAQVWQLTSANAISRLADVNLSGSTLSATVPGQSITLFVIPAGSQVPNVPPTAVLAATPVSGVVPLPVAFSAAGSLDSDGSIASYGWNFGDGSTGSGLTTTHSYANAGTYTATLTVTDNRGATATKTVTITASASVPNVPPTAMASATPTNGAAPLPVSFSAAGSVDSDGSIASYAWNFGDGSTGSGLTTTHTYGSGGTYTATLTVTDNRGATATKTVTITVTGASNMIFAPTDLLGSVSRGGGVSLAWADNSDNETGFSVERAVSGSSSYAVVGTTLANVRNFSQTGVAKGKYVYRVRAVNGATGAASAYSNLAYINITK